MAPISYDEYSFEETIDTELKEVIKQYDHIFNGSGVLEDVRGAWKLEKPAALIEIMFPEESQEKFLEEGMEPAEAGEPEEIGAFLFEISQWFYYRFDGYNLYISRFEKLPGILAGTTSAALQGVLFGYPTKDTAEFCIDKDCGDFKSRKEWH